MIQHPIPPVYDRHSEILILGSFPSVKSRETKFFYGHPQNRYWKVLAAVFGQEVPETIEDKKAFLLRNHIAAWDVIASCDITGSSDSSIKNARPNDFDEILGHSKISRVFCTGKTAWSLWKKNCAEKYEERYKLEVECLPSTSPANAACSLEKLIEAYKVLAID